MIAKWRTMFLGTRVPGGMQQDPLPSVIYKLPPEIWQQVLEHVDTHTDKDTRRLASVARTCHYLHDLATPVLYSNVTVTFDDNSPSLSCIEQLEKKPLLAAAVRKLMIHGGSGTQWNMNPIEDPPSVATFRKLFTVLPTMTGLRRLTCVLTPLFESFYYAIFSHPSLSHLSIYSPRVGIFGPFLSPELDGHFIENGKWEVPTPVDSELRSLNTNSALVMRSLILSGAAAHLRRLSVVLSHRDDRILLADLLKACINAQHVSFSGFDVQTPLPTEAVPRLQSFSGKPQDAALVVSGRPVTELELYPDLIDDEDTYDIECIPRALHAASGSTARLRNLSILMSTPREDTLHLIQRLFPDLVCLLISYQSMTFAFSSSRTFMEQLGCGVIGSFKRLTSFQLSWGSSSDYSTPKEWDAWEHGTVHELGKRCPSLQTICLQSGRKWVKLRTGTWEVDGPKSTESLEVPPVGKQGQRRQRNKMLESLLRRV